MKKTFCFFILLVITIQWVYGQNLVAEIPMKTGKAQMVYSSFDTYGNMAYIFQTKRAFQITVLNVEYKLTSQVIVDRTEADNRNEVIGITLNPDYVIVYLFDNKLNQLSTIIVDRKMETYQIKNNVSELGKNEFFLSAFEMDGVFHVISIPEGENALRLYRTFDGQNVQMQNHSITYQDFFSKLHKTNSKLNQSKGQMVSVERMNYNIQNTIKSSCSLKKMYTYGNKIVFTFDEPSKTHLVIIDPISQITIYREVNFTLENVKNATPKKGNTFLYKGDLFRLTMNKEQLSLYIINIDSMQFLKSYSVSPDLPISFKNGLIKEESSNGELNVVKNTKTLFKKMLRSEVAVAVNEADNQTYIVDIGAYEEVNVSRNSYPMGGGFPMGSGLSIGIGLGMGSFGMGGMGMGGFGLGGYGYPSYYYPDNGYTVMISTYFQSKLNINDLSYDLGEMPVTMLDKMKEYQENGLNKTSTETMNILPSYYGLVLGYYSKGSSNYNLVEFLK